METDADFRAAVAGHAADADAADLARPSWLFLHRPDGWADEFDELLDATGAAAAVDEAKALRKLAGAEARIAKLEADVAAAREELAAVRRARQAAGERVQAAEVERDALKEEVVRLRAELADARAKAKAVAVKPAPVEPPPPPPPEPAVEPTVDIAAVRQALTDALALLPDEPPPTPTPPPPASRARPRQRTAPRRLAVALPPGLLDDSAEAAEHLVRANGAIVLVDGYNATLSAWPDLPLAEQRSRLVDALAELAARTGVDATVVFDGAHEPTPGDRPARSPVKVRFSPPDVPADDVILDLVDAAPPHRPVVVASDDRAVQDGAARRGANIISRAQLLSTLRRGAR